MAALSTIALVGGLALGAAGTGVQIAAAGEAASAQKQQIAAEQKAEAIRQQQMELESSRRKREIIRQGIIARAQATSTATNQGAQFGTVLPGAESGIAGETGANYQGVSASESLGNQLFSANKDALRARSAEADAGTLGSLGGGLSSLGGALTKSQGVIGRIGYGY